MHGRCAVLAAAVLATGAAAVRTGGPRGWNSYDGWNGNANETDFIAAAVYQSRYLLRFGYDTATIDEGWYCQVPGCASSDPAIVDANGVPWPDSVQYPSSASGVGLRIISEQVHDLGLKLGVWTCRGIPRIAVEKKLPIANSPYTADQAARLDQNCSWSALTYGVLPNDAGLAYYRSLAASYKAQGIDLVKVDCMVGDHHGTGPGAWDGLYTDDFTIFAQAMGEAGLEVSVSPGASMNVVNATYIASNALAAQYRVTQDLWDFWADADPPQFYPTGLKGKLPVMATYATAGLIGLNGSYPDPDMLPVGVIYHGSTQHGPQGPPSPTHLTQDEQRTLMTLWCVARAPLVIGARLPLAPSDTWTLQLLTNPEVLAVQNASHGNRPIPVQQGANPSPDLHAWAAVPGTVTDGSVVTHVPVGAITSSYVALFNAADTPSTVTVALSDAGLSPSGRFCARDLWARSNLPGTITNGSFGASLPPHGAGIYLLSVC